MCIVTYFPNSDGFIFSSNRDENHNRPTLEPAFYAQPSALMYPKDLDHGGTWFALDSEQKQLFCVLNATGQQPKNVKKISRGQLPIKLLLGDKTILSPARLSAIAPFQLISIDFWESLKLEHFHWDGKRFTKTLIDDSKPHIWCSNTLYTAEKSLDLKTDYKNKSSGFKQWNDLISFHENVAQPLNNKLFLKKDKQLQTISITSLIFQNKTSELYYDNLLDENQYFKKAI